MMSFPRTRESIVFKGFFLGLENMICFYQFSSRIKIMSVSKDNLKISTSKEKIAISANKENLETSTNKENMEITEPVSPTLSALMYPPPQPLITTHTYKPNHSDLDIIYIKEENNTKAFIASSLTITDISPFISSYSPIFYTASQKSLLAMNEKTRKKLNKIATFVPEINNLPELLEQIHNKQYEGETINVIDFLDKINITHKTLMNSLPYLGYTEPMDERQVEEVIKEKLTLLFNALQVNSNIKKMISIIKIPTGLVPSVSGFSILRLKYQIMLAQLPEHIAHNTTLEYIHLDTINYLDLVHLFFTKSESLEDPPFLEKILKNRTLKEIGTLSGGECMHLDALRNMLSTNPIIESIAVIFDKQYENLFILNPVKLEHMTLVSNYRKAFFSALENNTNLIKLSLNFRLGYSYSTLSYLGNTLMTNQTLTHLSMTDAFNTLVDRIDIENCIQGLNENNSITYLNFSGNNIGNEGAKLFADSIVKKDNLKYLNLTHNRITEEGALKIAAALCRRKSLFSFIFGGHRDLGILGKDKWEEHITLPDEKNILNYKILSAFSVAAQLNTNIVRLDVSLNKSNSAYLNRLNQIINRNNTRRKQVNWQILTAEFPITLGKKEFPEKVYLDSFFNLIPKICDFVPEQMPSDYPEYLKPRLHIKLKTNLKPSQKSINENSENSPTKKRCYNF